MTPYKAAKKKFPLGTKVEVKTDMPEWNPGYPCDKVVCGHERYRDSDDDPLVCVALVSLSDARAGWFPPDNLILAKGAPKFRTVQTSMSGQEMRIAAQLEADRKKPVRGFLLLGEPPVLRRYRKDGSFVDFNIVHSDLEVEVIGEHDFYFYQGGPRGTRREIDHSRKTLGLPPWGEKT
jgi:hypothetical protein